MADLADRISELPPGASEIGPGFVDKYGTAFDATKHCRALHPTSRRLMPKGGRKPKSAEPSSSITSTLPANTAPEASANSSPSRPGSPGADPTAALGAEMAATMPEVTVTPTAAETAAASSNAKNGADPVGGSFIPTDEPEAAEKSTATDARAELMEDAKSSAEDNAEVACQTLYSLTGLVTGQTKEARPDSSEHAALRRTLAAYFRARGWVAVGTIAVVVSLFAYFIRTAQKDETAKVARDWWTRLWRTKAPPVPADRAENDAGGSGSASPAAAAPSHSRVIVVD